MGKLRDRMADDMKLKGLAPITQGSYLRYAQRFADHYKGRSPLRLGEREVRDFLLHLVKDEGIAPSTQGVCLASLQFLYRVTLRRPEVVACLRFFFKVCFARLQLSLNSSLYSTFQPPVKPIKSFCLHLFIKLVWPGIIRTFIMIGCFCFVIYFT